MKKTLLFLFLGLFFISCSEDDDFRHNPYLMDLKFSFHIDLTLPQYDNLRYPGGSHVESQEGINGVVIYNLNNSQYLAFEMTDPNHPLLDCSALQLNGTELSCGCEDQNQYSIVNGLQVSGEGEYTLKPYRVVTVGNILEVSN